jgi:hypothetical protein
VAVVSAAQWGRVVSNSRAKIEGKRVGRVCRLASPLVLDRRIQSILSTPLQLRIISLFFCHFLPFSSARRYALTGKEVKMILMQRLVKVDGKYRTDTTYPAGFMDVITLEKTDDHFR